MFKAFVVFISLRGNLNYAKDTRGPYGTKAQCEKRAMEISKHLLVNGIAIVTHQRFARVAGAVI